MQIQNKIKITMILIFLLSLLGPRLNSAKALSTSANLIANNVLVPNSLNTQSGSTTSESVDALTSRDQRGRDDNPKSYIEFQTTGGAYQGTQIFKLPEGMTNVQITTMELQVNYKGPSARVQKWTWYLFDTNKNSWVRVGASDRARADIWVLFRFRISNPDRFVDSNGQIQVMLQSNNSKGSAKLDYEAFHILYRTRSAPDKHPQPAYSPTPNAPSDSASATFTPTVVTATATATFTSTPTSTLPSVDAAAATATSTNIPVLPTDTYTVTPQASNTPFAVVTSTPTTFTASNTPFAVVTSTPTTVAASNTPFVVITSTPTTVAASNTPFVVVTSTPTTVAASNTPFAIVTSTPTASSVPAVTQTSVPTFTFTPSSIPPTTVPFTATYTPTQIILPTNTATPTSTFTATPTQTSNAYYVSMNGSDANAGTQAQPWKTIQKAANSGSGTIYVLAGTYPERVKITRAGLTFMAQGVVNMKGFTITANNTTIKGFNISTSVVTDPDGFGIKVSASGCLLEGNYIHDTGRDGVLLDNSTSQCVVRNNTFVHPSQSGVDVRGTNNIIESNDISGTYQHPPQWANPPSWVDADGIRFFGSGHIVRGNYIHDIYYGIPENIDPHIDCFQTWQDGSRGGAGKNILFAGNTCVLPYGGGGLLAKAWQVEGNPSGLTMQNNVIVTCLAALFNTAQNITFQNNTFIGSQCADAQGIHFRNTTVTLTKNIFVGFTNGVGAVYNEGGSAITANHNCYWNNFKRTPDSGDVYADPRMTSSYRLQGGSSCAGMGAYP